MGGKFGDPLHLSDPVVTLIVDRCIVFVEILFFPIAPVKGSLSFHNLVIEHLAFLQFGSRVVQQFLNAQVQFLDGGLGIPCLLFQLIDLLQIRFLIAFQLTDMGQGLVSVCRQLFDFRRIGIKLILMLSLAGFFFLFPIEKIECH